MGAARIYSPWSKKDRKGDWAHPSASVVCATLRVSTDGRMADFNLFVFGIKFFNNKRA
jgi:hypothetical protein